MQRFHRLLQPATLLVSPFTSDLTFEHRDTAEKLMFIPKRKKRQDRWDKNKDTPKQRQHTHAHTRASEHQLQKGQLACANASRCFYFFLPTLCSNQRDFRDGYKSHAHDSIPPHPSSLFRVLHTFHPLNSDAGTSSGPHTFSQ